MDAPCTDIWEIEDGKIIFAQLGVLANLQAALTPAEGVQDNDRHEPGTRASPAAAHG